METPNVFDGPNTNLVIRTQALLSQVQFLEYSFHVRMGHGGEFLQATYWEKDIYTSVPEIQYTRKWLLSPSMTDSEIIQTAFKLCMTSFEHRARESFMYRGARIFGPHFDVNDLVRLCQLAEGAGGRKPPEKH